MAERQMFSIKATAAESVQAEVQAVEKELERAGMCPLAVFMFTAGLGFLSAKLGRDGAGALLDRAIVAYCLINAEVHG
jgi:hypothetical protein